MVDPRTPVLIGGGQLSHRVDRGEEPLEPVDLMVEALRRAADASGAGSAAVTGADAVHIVSLLSWRYRDPGLLVAQRLGASPRHTSLSGMGGNSPQSLVNQACLAIRTGDADLVLLAGAEAWRTRMGARRSDQDLEWTVQGDEVPVARASTDDVPMSAPSEQGRGVVMPVQVYPMFEQAHRIGLGRGLDEHLVVASELWARFSEVAATNPHAWIQRAYTAEEIRTSSADNRMIGFPYTKLMNSNNAVEQGAGLILCSAERAEALGVPRDRWVFPHSGTDAHDHYFVSHRDDLGRSPAMRLAGRAALELAGVGVDDLAHVDIYSCFPSAVQIAAHELGLGLDRPLTVTGGMSFAGGPWNNYVMHSIATMADVLREDPGSRGLVTANGGFITKHAFGVYSTEPPAQPFRHADPQAEVDALPSRELCEDPDGEATIETWTVMHDRDGAPERAILTALLPDGRRAWGVSSEPGLAKALVTEDVAGRTVRLHPDGAVDLR
ncbi:MAG TPA: acetyl-CoA acetyltransferase [Acidimicrobiales bacterium]|nr:acetyl-CoA acetyltransferase [Acidimicrobiales bacterium]